MFDLFAPVRYLMTILRNNPLTLFMASIFSQFFIILLCGGIIVLYWTVKALSDMGLFEFMVHNLNRITMDAKKIAQICVPKLKNGMYDFYDCASTVDSKTYVPHKFEPDTEKIIDETNKLMQQEQGHEKKQ
jgi:hypothetical protein